MVSGLVLNFVPDKDRALREMRRIVKPGGTIAVYVWDYSGEMQLIRYFWDAVSESCSPMQRIKTRASSFLSAIPSRSRNCLAPPVYSPL